MGAAVGAFVGLPAMRLKHLYLAIATLSFQMIFQWVINFMTFFNQGQTIFVGRVRWFTGTVSRDGHYLFWYYVMLVVVILCGYAVRNLLRTRYGRCLVAVRDNDRAADAMGMHPGLTKVYAFALAGFFAGVAGALHAYVYRGAGFESFTLHHSITYLAMAIVGGLGTLIGSFLGPVAIMLLDLGVEDLVEVRRDPARRRQEPGDRAQAAGVRDRDRAVPDVRTEGHCELVAHRPILPQAVAVPVLTVRATDGRPRTTTTPRRATMKKGQWVLVTMAVLALAFAADVQAKTYKIASSLAITGPTSDAGAPYAKGMEDYAKYANDQKMLGDDKVEMIIRDDQYKTDVTKRNFEEFLSQGIVIYLNYSTGQHPRR